MAKAKAKENKQFIAIGVSWNNSYTTGNGKTKQASVEDFYDNDGDRVIHVLEVTLPAIENQIAKLPVTQVKVAA